MASLKIFSARQKRISQKVHNQLENFLRAAGVGRILIA